MSLPYHSLAVPAPRCVELDQSQSALRKMRIEGVLVKYGHLHSPTPHVVSNQRGRPQLRLAFHG